MIHLSDPLCAPDVHPALDLCPARATAGADLPPTAALTDGVAAGDEGDDGLVVRDLAAEALNGPALGVGDVLDPLHGFFLVASSEVCHFDHSRLELLGVQCPQVALELLGLQHSIKTN